MPTSQVEVNLKSASDVAALQARLRKDLDEAAAIRSDSSTEKTVKWVKKIQSAGQELAKSNAIVGLCSAEQKAEHMKLLARTVEVIHTAFKGHSDSLEVGHFAIVLATEEFKRRWGAPNQP